MQIVERFTMERGPYRFAGALALATVTLVILCNLHPKFNL